MITSAALGVAVFFATSPADAAIARDIEEKTEELRATASSGDAATAEKIRALEEAIQRGEKASAGLWSQIKSLEAEKAARENEKRALEKIQVVLTSGLIGALVTAFVAILGVFLNHSRGRAERDLKRLEVLAKTVDSRARASLCHPTSRPPTRAAARRGEPSQKPSRPRGVRHAGAHALANPARRAQSGRAYTNLKNAILPTSPSIMRRLCLSTHNKDYDK